MHMKSCGNSYVCKCGIRLCSLGALKRHCKYFEHEAKSYEPEREPSPIERRDSREPPFTSPLQGTLGGQGGSQAYEYVRNPQLLATFWDLLCPLSGKLLHEPVIAADGHSSCCFRHFYAS